MNVYEDDKIRIEIKKHLSEEEILARCFWILTMCGHGSATLELLEAMMDGTSINPVQDNESIEI